MGAKEEVINLYSNNIWEKLLANFKFWEEPYSEVVKLLPKKGVVLDLGCGEGFLANYLALASSQRKIVGVEIDGARLKLAEKGLKNTAFKVGDVTKIKIPKCDAIVIFHVLHHLGSYAKQEKLLKVCKTKLNKKGKLVVVEVNKKVSLKYFFAWITDHFLVPWVFEKRFYTKAYFRTPSEWESVLKNLGFKVKVVLAEEGRPFPNVIFTAETK